jgi:1,2-phenylacetyl-CoA epoxidase catalytic subunit
MSLGAPNELLRDVHQAAVDEVGHADQCWALAERYGFSRVSAAAFPIRDVKLAGSLAALAASAVREGCLAETLGAQVMASIAALVPDPEVKAAMTSIAREEATHAVLSFRIVAWALRVGGGEARAAVAAALAEPWPTLDTEELALRTDLSPSLVAEAARRALTDVLTPATARLLAA